jgi:glyoxylase-like metal-dependent hydrolase (beta-lactamase superfamily II)
MISLSTGISYFDLDFLGTPRVIATAVLRSPGGVALVDPGPSSTLPALRKALAGAGIAIADVNALLITHVHLDHAGATGTLLGEHPGMKVYVHEKGAPHMSRPEKLIASAARLYGGDMDRLWGEIRPVPESALVVLRGGERIEAGGQRLEVAYTPGHASHHVSYFTPDAGIAFVGDTAGVKLTPAGIVESPTPPPDIDLEAWSRSLDRIEGWRPETLFLTHFGPAAPHGAHIAELRENMAAAGKLSRELLEKEETDEAREAQYVDACRRRLRQQMSETEARTYETAGRFDLSWRGLARYWRKQAEKRT